MMTRNYLTNSDHLHRVQVPLDDGHKEDAWSVSPPPHSTMSESSPSRMSVSKSNIPFTEKDGAEGGILEAHSADRARILRKLDWYVLQGRVR